MVEKSFAMVSFYKKVVEFSVARQVQQAGFTFFACQNSDSSAIFAPQTHPAPALLWARRHNAGQR
jgi:hypothetical protein